MLLLLSWRGMALYLPLTRDLTRTCDLIDTCVSGTPHANCTRPVIHRYHLAASFTAGDIKIPFPSLLAEMSSKANPSPCPRTIMCRGPNASVTIPGAFLPANRLDETDGCPPFYQHGPDKDPLSVLLFTKTAEAGGSAEKNKSRVLIPSRIGLMTLPSHTSRAPGRVYAHRRLRLDEDPPVEDPTGSEDPETGNFALSLWNCPAREESR